MTPARRKITVLSGDGIGPEVVESALEIIKATGVAVEFEQCEAGARAFKNGIVTGIPKETIESIERTRVVLKGPLETPIGYGNRSANVTLRTLFETYGNIRPVRELPGVQTAFTGRKLDIVIVRENIEDLYAGIEYMQTPGVAEGLKLISREGCEKIVKLAFAFALAEGRQAVHCATKSNIMKLTEGLLQRTFEEFAPQYPTITSKHILIDNCAHQLAMRPEQFDDIELLGPHRELMGAVVDQDMLRRNRRILRRKLLEGALQQTLGELHDVRLRCAMNRLTSLGERECECELHDLLASFARDQLETLRHAGRLHVLDARVQVLDVLADDDDVELAAGEGGLHSWQLTDWPDVAVRLEQGAKRDVGASIAVADRCLEGTLEHDAGSLYRLDRFLRNSGDDPLFECPR